MPFSSNYSMISVRLLMHQSPCFYGLQFTGSPEHWLALIPNLNRTNFSVLNTGMSFSVGPKTNQTRARGFG